jgi:thiosulfate reductase cytochrome b subunit
VTLSDSLKSFRSSRWFKLVWIVPVVIVVLAIVVVAAEIIRVQPAVQSFLRTYPGFSGLPSFAPVGFPAWLEWQHGLNVFFMLFIVRSGWLIRTTKRPDAYWTRDNNGPIRTKGAPVRISLHLWLHLSFDILFVLNGIVFYVLIFSTGQWVRIIPTRWDIFPNAISAGLQYASLHWPLEQGWSNYNALQTISYFLLVFIAAPLAIITGLRMSPGLASRWRRFENVYPITVARRIHFPVMIFFVAFTIVHVTLVFATGALNNLNHMYAGRNDDSWVGFWIFAASLVVMVAAWFAARPLVLRSIAGLTGRVGR